MKAEAVCDNIDCPTVIDLGVKPHFRHIHLVDEDDLVCVRCHRELRVLTLVPEGHKFAMGKIAITRLAKDVLGGSESSIADVLTRHVHGDWSGMNSHDRRKNMEAVKHDDPPERDRVFSVFTINDRDVWVITEAGRHETTILTPEEY